MSIGILEPKDAADPLDAPGTRLFDPPLDEQSAARDQLKRDKKNPEIILQPQPADSPEDPLNWSRFRKEAFYLSFMTGTIGVGVVGPAIVPAAIDIITAFPGTTATKFVALIGFLVLTYGISSYICVALSDSVGRRPAFLVSNVLLVAGIIWGATAQSYSSFLGARILQGFGMGAYGCLGSSVITDIFFLHEQGVRIALWQMVFNGSICLSPILSGLIAQQLGWRYIFWILLPIALFASLTCIFLQPETMYHRDVNSPETVPGPSDSPIDEKDIYAGKAASSPVIVELPESIPSQPSYLATLMPWKRLAGPGTPIWISLVRPWLTLLSPPIAYAALLFTFTFSWFVLLASIYSSLYSAAPYNFGTAQIGYISGCSPFIGVMVAVASAGPLLDHSARWLSRRNNGVFEPEMRLILVIPTAICIAIGAFGYGHSMKVGDSWVKGAVYLAFLNAGATYGTICGISYGISVYPARGGDTFGIIMLVKALYAWSSTLYIATWLGSAGIFKWCSTVAAVTLSVCLLAIPMYIFGKRLRVAMSKVDSLRWVFE